MLNQLKFIVRNTHNVRYKNHTQTNTIRRIVAIVSVA